jgi:hypothetical protein
VFRNKMVTEGARSRAEHFAEVAYDCVCGAVRELIDRDPQPPLFAQLAGAIFFLCTPGFCASLYAL